MFKSNTLITIAFSVFFFINICYSETKKQNTLQQQNLKEKNYYEIVKNIPVSFGKVFETNINNEEKPDIIIINDLHSQDFAQKNIYSIIKYIKSKIDIDKIFIEGAAKGKINYSSITNIKQDIRQSFLSKMLNKGIVSGAEYFCYTTNTELYGIEDFSLYTETLKLAYIIMRNENYFSVRIEKVQKELNKIKKNFYSKDMFEFEYLFFNRTNIETKKYYKELVNITKKYSININKYPEIYNFINIINCDIKLEFYKKNFSKDFNYLVQKMKNYTPFNVYSKFINNCKEKNMEDNLIYCYKFTNSFLNQKEKDYFSYINILIQKQNFDNIFNTSKYLDEEETFYNDILNKIFKTEEEKNIVFISQMIFLTEKYTKLNIDFYNFNKFIQNKNKFIELLNKTNYIKNKKEITDVLNNEELSVYYENNIKRNFMFFNNIKNLMTEGTINILVVGGFHKDLLNLFNENGKKYIVIFPNTKKTDSTLYRQLILDIGSYSFLQK